MLKDKLEAYSKSGIYPFHMPGHKRRADMLGELCTDHDLTEVEGTDDLHCADGIIKDAMENAAEFFGADRTFFLVNGSTCGILAALAACTKRGDRIICARNCHKSVYNGIALLGLVPSYIYPPIVSPLGIHGSVPPSAVVSALERDGGAKAVILTSPTYEGVISDISSIAEICRRYGAILIVDEAHGAHLGHFDGFPQGAVRSGADIVIQSAHKTLCALTQSALLHVCGERVSYSAIAEKLAVFETSSPSYLITESIDSAVCRLQSDGKRLFCEYKKRLDRFSKKAEELKNIDILFYGKDGRKTCADIFAFDRSKLIISGVRLGLSGSRLAERLLKNYKIQIEMSSLNYVIAMTSYCDTDEGFERLFAALKEIDGGERGSFAPGRSALLPTHPERAMEISEAAELECEEIPLDFAEGRISGGFVFAYPPGIPLVVPGEIISAELIKLIRTLDLSGVAVKGSAAGAQRISAVKELGCRRIKRDYRRA